MKNLTVLFSTLALLGVIALFGMKLAERSGNNDKGAAKSAQQNSGANIAYVNIDTLQENYEYFRIKKEELESRQKSMSDELKRSQQKFEKDYMAAQRKVQAGTMTQAEAQSTGKRLEQMQQSLQARDAALTEQLIKEQDDFNADLQKRLDDYLKKYNEDKNYDYILTYSQSLRTILLANESLDITNDVIEGMNEEYSKEPKDSKKKETENK